MQSRTGVAAPLRLDAIDVVRGAMMIAIAWVHGLANLEPGHRRFDTVLGFALSSTVGFTTVSGLLVGWFAVVKRARFDAVARRYAVQAARLVAIVHPLIVLALLAPARVAPGRLATRSMFITDTLAVIFFFVVPRVPRLGARARLGLGIALIGANALLGEWSPVAPAAQLVQELLCGVDPARPHILAGNYGLLPITGMFLVGTWLGAALADAQLAGRATVFAQGLTRLARRLVAFGAAILGVWLVARALGLRATAHALYPQYEASLYPVYLAGTIWLVGRLLAADLRGPIARALALIGRTSLFVYVAQYVLFETVPTLIGGHAALSPLEWVALCGAASPLLVAAAHTWSSLAREPKIVTAGVSRPGSAVHALRRPTTIGDAVVSAS